MSETRRKYTKEFKIEAVRLFETSSKSGREIEQDLGIGKGVLYRWKRELQLVFCLQLTRRKVLRTPPVHGAPLKPQLHHATQQWPNLPGDLTDLHYNPGV
jgi:hypothetical protein